MNIFLKLLLFSGRLSPEAILKIPFIPSLIGDKSSSSVLSQMLSSLPGCLHAGSVSLLAHFSAIVSRDRVFLRWLLDLICVGFLLKKIAIIKSCSIFTCRRRIAGSVLFFVSLSPGVLCAQSEMVIGLPANPSEFNLLSSKNAASLLLSELILGKLLKAIEQETGDLQYSFDLASGLEIAPDRKSISIFIPAGIQFQSGATLQVHDLLYSLTRCINQGIFADRWEFQALSAELARQRIQLRFQIRSFPDAAQQNSNELLELFLRQIGSCPVLEESSSRVFADLLGYGTNVVSTGSFRIYDFRPAHFYRLERMKAGEPGTRLPERLELRIFPDPAQALAALRVGNIQLFFTENQEVIERAQKDETLFISKCSIYSVVLRKGLHFACDPGHPLVLSF